MPLCTQRGCGCSFSSATLDIVQSGDVISMELAADSVLNDIQVDIAALEADFTDWTSYTPTLGGTGWARGTGGAAASEGLYTVSNGTVHFWASITFGTSGATFGSAAPSISLPSSHTGGYSHTNNVRAWFRVGTSGAITPGAALLADTFVSLYPYGANTTYVQLVIATSTVPFTWVAGDQLIVAGWYRRT